ncbi:MAG TPA: thiamine pyrophosphate-binding protein [Candidatus Saccharimonadales bacterium]|nr:thiamine pyrophosphate-binding protein [Candidatus Saccharimonadales bacterium]
MAASDAPRFGSDVMVDLLIEQDIPYVALNPGASFRGLHDSLVNRPGAPEIIVCPHEKLAVNLAHGYAKATGKPMAAILHNVVGLLHGTLGVFTAYVDRSPVIVLGGCGPMDTERRRPWIDWLHTANIQGNAVRDFTKWDDQPASIEAMPAAFARARRIALTEPAGPVYLALDADLQEREFSGEVPVIDWAKVGPGSPMAPDQTALNDAVDRLVAAERPVIVAGYAGREPRAFEWIPTLAESLGAGVIDMNSRLNLPTTHRLNVTGTEALADADVVLLLDMKDTSKVLREVDSATRIQSSKVAAGTQLIEIGFNDLQASSWIHDVGPIHAMDVSITADTTVALPILIERVGERVAADTPARAEAREARRTSLADLHRERRASWRAVAERRWEETPISPARLAAEVGDAIAEHDWVLTAGTANEWALRLWDFDKAYRHPGRTLGTATQIGLSLGVALAHRDQGRLVVDLQPDGDLMFDPGALWVASAHRIPMLVVMFNNRAYYNDWEHQIRLAKARGSDLEKAHIGVNIDGPAPDFAGLARSFGWAAEGPIEDPDAIGDAVRRAVRIVLEEGRPALVDVVCAHR